MSTTILCFDVHPQNFGEKGNFEMQISVKFTVILAECLFRFLK